MEASQERPAPVQKSKTIKNYISRYRKAKPPKTTAASENGSALETLERRGAKPVTAKSILVTHVPSPHESVDPTKLPLSKGATQPLHYEHGQGSTPSGTGEGKLRTHESTAPDVRGEGKEKQDDSSDRVPMGLPMGSMSEKVDSKVSSGSTSDGGQLNRSLQSELRRGYSTAATSIKSATPPKTSESGPSPSAANALENSQEADTEDKEPVRHVDHQVAELDGTSLRRDQSDIVLQTEAAMNENVITVPNASATTGASTTADTENAVRVGNLWVLPTPPLGYSRLAIYTKNIKPNVDWLLQFSKGSTNPQDETAFAELLMVRRNDIGDFGPTVVFGSRVLKRRRQIANFLDGALREQFSKFGLSWSIEDADESALTFLGSLYMSQTLPQASGDPSQRQFSVDIGFLPTKTNVCGARILVQEENLDDGTRGPSLAMMTIGGIIIVDDRPYGLTVAHPVSMLNRRKSDYTSSKATWGPVDDIHDVPVEKQDNNTFTSHEAFAERSHWPRTHLFRSLGSISAFAYSDQRESVNVAKNSDWTLISIEPDMILPNLIPQESGSSLQLIQDIVTQAEIPRKKDGLTEVRCTIVTARGAIQARLSHGSSMLEISGSSFQVERIELNHPLGKNLTALFETLAHHSSRAW